MIDPLPEAGLPVLQVGRYTLLSLAAIAAQLLYAAPSHWKCIISGD
jgi:hypothetical protein